MSDGCPDCGCPLEVCCGQNRKKYVPVSELKREIEYLINWGKFQQATNEIYRHTTDSLNDLWIEKLENKLKELGLSEKKKETKKEPMPPIISLFLGYMVKPKKKEKAI